MQKRVNFAQTSNILIGWYSMRWDLGSRVLGSKLKRRLEWQKKKRKKTKNSHVGKTSKIKKSIFSK